MKIQAPNTLSSESLILATCPKGVSPWLAKEMERLGYGANELKAGVETEGTLFDCMLLNLRLSMAHRVLFRLAAFAAEEPDVLYKRARAIPWERYFSPDGYFTVSASIQTDIVNDSRYAGLLVKDAVVDRFREKTGRRPDSGGETTGASVFLFWRGTQAVIYIDTTGEPLSRRGYRKIPGKAPMQETLAAACLEASGWDGKGNVVNPMCGSGTLAIEAALRAIGRAPGLFRPYFSFMALAGFDVEGWGMLRDEARKCERAFAGKIVATDHDPRVLAGARKNAQAAGVEKLIDFSVCDYSKTHVPPGDGLVILNPEYGRRLGEEKELEPVYSGMGDFFKKQCSGYTGAVFTGNPSLAKKVGLKARRRIEFWNAKIDCRLLLYDLYAGTRRQPARKGEKEDN